MSNEKVNNLIVDTLTLTTLLIDKFEQLEESKIFAHKSKQSLKSVRPHLQNYIDKIFNFEKDTEQDEIDFKNGATVVSAKMEKVESILQEDVIVIGDRKQLLESLLDSYDIDKTTISEIIKKVDILDILKF